MTAIESRAGAPKIGRVARLKLTEPLLFYVGPALLLLALVVIVPAIVDPPLEPKGPKVRQYEYRIIIEIPDSETEPEVVAAAVGRSLIDTILLPVGLVAYDRADVTPARGTIEDASTPRSDL